MKGLFDIKEGISVSVSKNIPIAAGFGGGSADAAATLKALNELWGLNLKIKDLIKIGDDIGADVPFFIAGKTCFAAGKGGILEIINLPEMNILAVNPGYGISTKDAYEKLDKIRYEKKFSSLRLKNAKNLSDVARNIHNDFIHIQKDDVKGIIEELKKEGALNASITGKGPSVFGIFEDRGKAEKAYQDLKDRYKFVYLCKTVK